MTTKKPVSTRLLTFTRILEERAKRTKEEEAARKKEAARQKREETKKTKEAVARFRACFNEVAILSDGNEWVVSVTREDWARCASLHHEMILSGYGFWSSGEFVHGSGEDLISVCVRRLDGEDLATILALYRGEVPFADATPDAVYSALKAFRSPHWFPFLSRVLIRGIENGESDAGLSLISGLFHKLSMDYVVTPPHPWDEYGTAWPEFSSNKDLNHEGFTFDFYCSMISLDPERVYWYVLPDGKPFLAAMSRAVWHVQQRGTDVHAWEEYVRLALRKIEDRR